MVEALVGPQKPLVALIGPTGSGKSSLALRLAEHFHAEILSCDSVAVYRGMDLGTAKPPVEDRQRVHHHLIDVVEPTVVFNAGDYSRVARAALASLPGLGIVAGGTGLYLRALLDGLFPAPAPQPRVRERLRQREAAHLHRLLHRLDQAAAAAIHPHDKPKLVRAIEVSLAGRRPITQLWEAGRERLAGYSVLKLGLRPPREALYDRINRRAADMFAGGLVEETRGLLARYGPQRAFESLGYAEAAAVLRGDLTLDAAITRAQQGHRNYAKRQGTWFRREKDILWLDGFGEDAGVVEQARHCVATHLAISTR